jgi:hypothetical protein
VNNLKFLFLLVIICITQVSRAGTLSESDKYFYFLPLVTKSDEINLTFEPIEGDKHNLVIQTSDEVENIKSIRNYSKDKPTEMSCDLGIDSGNIVCRLVFVFTPKFPKKYRFQLRTVKGKLVNYELRQTFDESLQHVVLVLKRK